MICLLCADRTEGAAAPLVSAPAGAATADIGLTAVSPLSPWGAGCSETSTPGTACAPLIATGRPSTRMAAPGRSLVPGRPPPCLLEGPPASPAPASRGERTSCVVAEGEMPWAPLPWRSEEHTSELQSLTNLVC